MDPARTWLPRHCRKRRRRGHALNPHHHRRALNNQNADPIVFGRNGQPLSASNTLRGGDVVTFSAVGIMTYTWAGNSASSNSYRLRPSARWAVRLLSGRRPSCSTRADSRRSRFASFNVLNYFNTWDGLPDTVDNCTNGVGGAPTDCRGADIAGRSSTASGPRRSSARLHPAPT